MTQPITDVAFFVEARRSFHAALFREVLTVNSSGVPSNSDSANRASVALAKGVVERLGTETPGARLAGQMAGNKFEEIVCNFVEQTFLRLAHLRPGYWSIRQVSSRSRAFISQFEQYAHLHALQQAAANSPELAAALGNDYAIAPDIVVVRGLEPDERINEHGLLVDDGPDRVAKHSALRATNLGLPILHASISCKWTMRSDRAQNARSEALNLIRNRKGRLPHVVVVTGEPAPSRLSALALGTGDIDCVYHFALPELLATVEQGGDRYDDTLELLRIMVDGKRLKDIADLPLDLAV